RGDEPRRVLRGRDRSVFRAAGRAQAPAPRALRRARVVLSSGPVGRARRANLTSGRRASARPAGSAEARRSLLEKRGDRLLVLGRLPALAELAALALLDGREVVVRAVLVQKPLD